MKNFRRIKPFIFTVVGSLPALVFFSCFLFIPYGADLTTAQGDYYLGKMSANFIQLGALIDVVRFCLRRHKSKTSK